MVKGFRTVRQGIKDIQYAITALQNDVKMLKCDHRNTMFVVDSIGLQGKECKDCGKWLGCCNKVEYLNERLETINEEYENIMTELEELEVKK